MKITTLILIASAAIASAGTIEMIDDKHPSKVDDKAILNAPDGRHVQVTLITFGTDRIKQAKEYGMFVKYIPNAEDGIWSKAAQLYPGDSFFQKAFHQYAMQTANP